MKALILLCIVSALPMAALAQDGWRVHEVYQPRIERACVLDAYAQTLTYNHDSSVAWFGDRWFCLWNAHEKPAEGTPGQLNYVSTSRDAMTWSAAEAAFASEQRSANPIPCPTGTQWQPNLIVVGNELWAVWSQNSKDNYNGCYVSRLQDPDGKWINRRLEWDGRPDPEVDGKRWRLFPTQNPVRLRSGRILAPVTMIGPHAADAPPAVKSWWAMEKRDSVLYSDDAGKTWLVSAGAVQPKRTWAQWEPTVWELPDGAVMMFSRNNDFRGRSEEGPRPAEMLLWSVSRDGGVTWTPHEYVPLETVASRMHVLPAGGDRHMMVHNDWPADRFVSDRLNLALFFTRGTGFDFVAGPGLTGVEPVVCYPQMDIRDNAVVISYSQGLHYRSIRLVRVSPLPAPDRYYLFPRSNVPPSPRPARENDAFCFNTSQHIATREIVDAGADGFSAGVWIRPDRGGVILDTRSATSRAGFVLALSGGGERGFVPFVFLGTPERNIFSSLRVALARWNYLGVTVDGTQGVVTFCVNGRTDQARFTKPPMPFRGVTGHIGAKRFAESHVEGLTGQIRAMALYRSALFTPEQHNWLNNAFAEKVGLPRREPAVAPDQEPALWFDPADAAFERHFALPDDEQPGAETTAVEGGPALRLKGDASAGVDLDANDRARGDTVRIRFRFRIESGDEHILCTTGDANEPARLVARKGEAFLESKGPPASCGKAAPGVWHTAELSTGRETTTARVNDGAPAQVGHRPLATWLYLGEGYRTGRIPAANRFLIDVGSVRSKVERAAR